MVYDLIVDSMETTNTILPNNCLLSNVMVTSFLFIPYRTADVFVVKSRDKVQSFR